MDPEADFQLCDDVFGRLTDDKPKRFDFSMLPDVHRVVVLVWHFTGIIDNSGFEGLLSRTVVGDPNLALLRSAFDSIGRSDLIGNVFEVFPGNAPPAELEQRMRQCSFM